MGSGRLQPSAVDPGLFIPSGRVAHGLFSVRAWLWLVVAIKSEVERHNLLGKPDNDLHGEVVRYFNTCSLGENPPKHPDVIVRLLFVAYAIAGH